MRLLFSRNFTAFTSILALAALVITAAQAGPFAPAAGQPGSTAVSSNDASITAWATGYSAYQVGANVDTTWQTPGLALGSATGDSFGIVGLGDAGRITLSFAGSIYNGPGWDFAVFENSFSDTFLELAFVEVSSNGTSFFRFPSFSLTPAAVGAFGTMDPTNIDGLAGKYRQGFGTAFDLDIFRTTPGIDINDIRFVRIVDIVGNGSSVDNWPTNLGGPHPIYDPYPTIGSAGFDLDAVAVRYLDADPPPVDVSSKQVPIPATFALLLAGALGMAGARRLERKSMSPDFIHYNRNHL